MGIASAYFQKKGRLLILGARRSCYKSLSFFSSFLALERLSGIRQLSAGVLVELRVLVAKSESIRLLVARFPPHLPTRAAMFDRLITAMTVFWHARR